MGGERVLRYILLHWILTQLDAPIWCWVVWWIGFIWFMAAGIADGIKNFIDA